eukprot:EG_transcript_13073
MELCSAILDVAREVQAQRALIDEALYEELHFSYTCRIVNSLTLHPDDPDCEQVLQVYEVVAAKEAALNEWMYELAETTSDVETWLHWRKCWQLLRVLNAPSVRCEFPDVAGALEALRRHLAEQPDDNPARWLESVLERRLAASPPPPVPRQSGALLYNLNVCLPPTIERASRPSEAEAGLLSVVSDGL